MGRINTARFITACKDSGAIITLIAKRLSCDRHTVYNFIKANPEMLKYLDDARDSALDIAESKILSSIVKATPVGDMEDVKWYLSRIGKKRGFADKDINITNAIQNNIATYKFIIEKPDDNRTPMETEPETVKEI